MRDHESGARAVGVPVPSLKLLAFLSGAAPAALGGGMLGMGSRAFDPEAFDPVRGLLWFAAVVVLGADGPWAPCFAAALLIGLAAGTHGGVAAAVIGALAGSGRPLPRRPPRGPAHGAATPVPGTVRETHAHPAGNTGTPTTPPGPCGTGRPATTDRSDGDGEHRTAVGHAVHAGCGRARG